MTRTIVEINGTRFVLISEAEFRVIEEASLPPLPPEFPDGTVEALPYVRASIARDIIKSRRELGLNRAELATLAGIRQTTLSRVESAKYKPNMQAIARIERALERARKRA